MGRLYEAHKSQGLNPIILVSNKISHLGGFIFIFNLIILFTRLTRPKGEIIRGPWKSRKVVRDQERVNGFHGFQHLGRVLFG